jgi:TonB family protein
MSESTEHGPQGIGIAESRVHARVDVHSLAYIELGDGNAGIILNISETGLGVQTIQILNSDEFSRMTFRLPRTDKLIEASGKVVWQIRSKKQAGIEFVRLPDAARAAIKNWMAEALRPVEAAADEAQAVPEPIGPAPSQPADSFPRIGQVAAIHQLRPEAPNAAKATEIAGEPGDPPLSSPTPARVRPMEENPLRLPLTLDGSLGSVNSDGRHPLLGTPGSVPLPHFGYIPPGTAVDLKKPRRWWSFAATVGLLTAAAFAALTTFDPGAITRAKMAVFAYLGSPSASEQSADQTDQPGSSAQQTAANGQGSPSDTPTAPDAQGTLPTVLPGDTDTPPDSGNGVVPTSNQPDENPASTTPSQTPEEPHVQKPDRSRSTGAGEENTPTQPQSAVAPSNGGSYQSPSHSTAAQNHAFEPGPRASNGNERPPQTGRESTYDRYASRTAGQPSQTTANNSDNTNTEREVARASSSGTSPGVAQPGQSPSVSSGQAALNAWRAQTAPPSSGPSVDSSRRTEPAHPAERDQDLYARRDSTSSPAAGSNQTARLGQQPKSLEMPSSYSSPVAPSLPLSGIPSGSVAASSQFRGIVGQIRAAGQLQIGQLTSSYSPAYPVEAARKRIEGTVRLSLIVGRDGIVRSVRVVSGPAMLTSVAAAAVRDWRYSETFLAGQPIETEQYVTIVFRLSGK